MDLQLDIILVNVGGSKKQVYQDLSKEYSAIEPPFWAALIAGFLRKKGFNVEIIDANAENLTHEETSKIIEQKNPKLVNIVVYGQHPSASTQLMTSVGNLCKTIKNLNNFRRIILTGLHPSALPKRTIEEEECDYVCEGEGFYTLLELLKEKPHSQIPGLWYKENNEIKSTLRAQNIINMNDELNEVAWDLLPMDKYRAHNWQCLDNLNNRRYYASFSTSLGCPFNCSFCSIKATFGGDRRMRYWDPEWVLKQIDILVKKHNVKIIKIIDEMFLFDPKHCLAIAKGLIDRNYDLNIWAYARVDVTQNLDINVLKMLRKAGFKWLCFGFEAASEAVLNEVGKGRFNKQDMINIRNKVKEAGINVLGNFIFGLPEDDFNSMQETLNLAIDMNCEFANFYCAIAWPGSQLYNQMLEGGIEFPLTWADYAQHAYSFIPLPTDKLFPKEVLEFRDYAFNAYFKNPRFLKSIEEKFGIRAREHIESMTIVNLKRKLLNKEEPNKMLTKKDLLDFEEEIREIYESGKIKAPVHFCKGNEDALIEIFKDVKKEDWVFSTHRSHYHALLKGINKEWLKKEILEKRSIHLNNKEHNFFTSAIVGGTLPIALGTALALKLKKSAARVWCFAGDMAAKTGVFHECIEYAKGHDLPITFVIEDNGLSVNTPTEKVWGDNNLGNARILKYKYTRECPHHGSGKWVTF